MTTTMNGESQPLFKVRESDLQGVPGAILIGLGAIGLFVLAVGIFLHNSADWLKSLGALALGVVVREQWSWWISWDTHL